MGISSETWWFALVFGGAPLLVWVLLTWWNEIWYIGPLKLRYSGYVKLPPGTMGLPYFGEMLSFLWYFKILHLPDEFIEAKKQRQQNRISLRPPECIIAVLKLNCINHEFYANSDINSMFIRYGEGVGVYQTCLFGTPSIISCSPASNKFFLQRDDIFPINWPSNELLGESSVAVVNGKAHTRLRSYVFNAINSPDALKRIFLVVQPRISSSLQLWADKVTLNGMKETKKVTFANIGKMFANFEPGLVLDSLDGYFAGIIGGVRAQRINVPGTTYHHALKCRKSATDIFRKELESRRLHAKSHIEERNDLMDGLINMKDKQGKKLGDGEVIDNIVSLVIAGYESTSLASMWSFYYLAKFPDVLQKLRVLKYQKIGKSSFGYDIFTQTQGTIMIQCPLIQTDGMVPRSLVHSKSLVEEQGYVQGICLLEFRLQFSCIIWPLATSK
ncbi:ent-kaurenoic acid oxidase 2-like [Papaver somniferum]|uniref:ent-kaurenoic acid oxidase 2-like n=1 Tax=Papaver somniferum TaxID=3469 RepID=UPI000E6FEBC9|nr:ent-kaurenoic acid oxidase 2-like [Papaver somniferum]